MKGRHQKFQFGLRKLLLWTAVIAVLLGIPEAFGLGPCVSVFLACYVAVTALIRKAIGPMAACVFCIAIVAGPLLLMTAIGSMSFAGDALAGSLEPGEFYLWLRAVAIGIAGACVLGLTGFGFAEAVVRAVDWADERIQSQTPS